MNETTPKADGSPLSIAGTLLASLQQEREVLVRLCRCFETQLEAMRTRVPEQLEAATLSVTEEVGTLAGVQHMRERQMRLLGRILNLGERPPIARLAEALQQMDGAATVSQALLEARALARKQAEITQERCRELEFAISYASDLGRDMLATLQGSGASAPTLAYTSSGQAAGKGSGSSFVNRQG